jgi:hypothetical protein
VVLYLVQLLLNNVGPMICLFAHSAKNSMILTDRCTDLLKVDARAWF